MLNWESKIQLVLCAIVILPHVCDSLSCYICAENNLDEFGECATPFQYDCTNYERRYPNEKVFCRTTRHRSVNGTYTIVKECISETAHYSTFPQKNYKLDEECDVIDVDGFEVAYCLCRNNPLCNQAPIVDQFTAFENKYPEFFDPAPEGKPSDDNGQRTTTTTVASSLVPTSASRSTLVEGNVEARKRPNSPFVVEDTDRREDQEEVVDDTEAQLKKAAEAELAAAAIRTTERANNFETTTDRPTNTDWKPSGGNVEAPAFFPQRPPTVSQHSSVISTESSVFGNAALTTQNPFASQTGSPVSTKCTDCSPQVVVNCDDRSQQIASVGRQLCFSRQIVTEKGHYGVEKMCVPERAMFEEFGKDAVLDGCQTIESGSIISNYCVCSKSQCNRASVMEQMVFEKTKNGNENIPLPPLRSSTTTTSRSLLDPTENGFARQELEEVMSCAVCLDAEIKDAMSDCSKQSVSKCAQQKSNQKVYCLTRQTQNGKGSFIVEKKCLDKREFHQSFPEEEKFSGKGDIQPRCASTYDGYVNFCVCDSSLCNQDPLPQQAERMTSRIQTTTPSLVVFGDSSSSSKSNNKMAPAPMNRFPSTTTPFGNRDRTNAATKGIFGEEEEEDEVPQRAKQTTPSSVLGTSTKSSFETPSTSTNSSVKERLERWKASTTQADSGAPAHRIWQMCAFLAMTALISIIIISVIPEL